LKKLFTRITLAYRAVPHSSPSFDACISNRDPYN
jgi:hypothetical protein